MPTDNNSNFDAVWRAIDAQHARIADLERELADFIEEHKRERDAATGYVVSERKYQPEKTPCPI